MRESPPVRSFYNQKGMTEPKQPHRNWNSERTHTHTHTHTKYTQAQPSRNERNEYACLIHRRTANTAVEVAI